jgi:hypothetical protein
MEIFYFLDAILLNIQTSQFKVALKAFNFRNGISFNVKTFKVPELFEMLYLLQSFEMEVEFLIEIGGGIIKVPMLLE